MAENFKEFFYEKLEHLYPLSKKFYIIQQIYVIVSLFLFFRIIFYFIKVGFNPIVVGILGIDILFYLLITLSFDNLKNYRIKFYEDKISYSFEVINYSRKSNYVNSEIIIKNIEKIDYASKNYCYVYGDISIIFTPNNEQAKQVIEGEDVKTIDKVRIPLDFKDRDEIIANLNKFRKDE